jgi:hypothetical protein
MRFYCVFDYYLHVFHSELCTERITVILIPKASLPKKENKPYKSEFFEIS